jgi:geranylgeranylglycerol-phosphate geranylgeranyltransferase
MVSAVIAVAVSFIPYLWWGIWYIIGIIAVDIIIIIAAFRGLNCETPPCVKASKVSTLLKAGMFASLIVFCLSAIFL